MKTNLRPIGESKIMQCAFAIQISTQRNQNLNSIVEHTQHTLCHIAVFSQLKNWVFLWNISGSGTGSGPNITSDAQNASLWFIQLLTNPSSVCLATDNSPQRRSLETSKTSTRWSLNSRPIFCWYISFLLDWRQFTIKVHIEGDYDQSTVVTELNLKRHS